MDRITFMIMTSQILFLKTFKDVPFLHQLQNFKPLHLKNKSKEFTVEKISQMSKRLKKKNNYGLIGQ